MEFGIRRATLEALVKTAIDKAYDENDRDNVMFPAGEDHFLLSADGNPHVIDGFHQVYYERVGRSGIANIDLNGYKKLMTRHNLVADAHTHMLAPEPSDGDIRFRQKMHRELGKHLYMAIIGGMMLYVSRINNMARLHKGSRKRTETYIRAHEEFDQLFNPALQECDSLYRDRAPPRDFLIEKAFQLYMAAAHKSVKMYDWNGKQVGLRIV